MDEVVNKKKKKTVFHGFKKILFMTSLDENQDIYKTLECRKLFG